MGFDAWLSWSNNLMSAVVVPTSTAFELHFFQVFSMF